MRKTLRKNFKLIKITTFLLVISIILGSTFLFDSKKANAAKFDTDYDLYNRNTFISTDEDGVLKIKRDLFTNEKPMSKKESWTIFMYVTGTNLESQYRAATKDFKELLEATYGSKAIANLNIVIQTGGCSKWHSNNISSEKLQRYTVTNKNKLELVEEKTLSNMGDPATLYDFLKWGVKNYPAKHMGVIFWDHGSGIESGICQDPNFEDDSLTPNEFEYAFAKMTSLMTTRFDFVGFDTCLSGSLEYANLLAPYAKYLIGSSDLEPNNGWHYTPIVKAILDNPSISALDLGKVICDSYKSYYEKEPYISKTLTMGMYDLSKVDDVLIETNYLAKYMLEHLISNTDNFVTFSNNLKNCTRYSDTTIDLGSLLHYFDTTSDYDYDTYFYRKALDEFIIYSHIGSTYANKNCLGLSLYYNSKALSMYDFEHIRNCIFSPYWLEFIARMSYIRSNDTMTGYDNFEWRVVFFHNYFYEYTFNFLNYRTFDKKNSEDIFNSLYEYDDYRKLAFSMKYNFKDYEDVSTSPFIFSESEYNSNDNIEDSNTSSTQNFVLSNENFNLSETHINANIQIINYMYVSQLTNSIFAIEKDTLIYLGENNNLNYDISTNIASTSSVPEWLCLPDGQYVSSHIISQTKNSTIYGIPVLIDNVPSTIRCVEYKDSDGTHHYSTLGVWDTTDGCRHAGRSYLPLKLGTSITPIYTTYNLKTKKYSKGYGNKFVVNSDFNFLMSLLPDGNYYYSFNLEGINSQNYMAKLHPFCLKDSLLLEMNNEAFTK